MAAKGSPDTVTVIGRVAYLHTPDGFGTSELAKTLTSGRSNPLADGTARNWATVTALLALCEADVTGTVRTSRWPDAGDPCSHRHMTEQDTQEKQARGTPVGRRVVLGMVGLGAVGVAAGRWLSEGVSDVVASTAPGPRRRRSRRPAGSASTPSPAATPTTIPRPTA